MLQSLPIVEFLPPTGRITKQAYLEAIRKYIEIYSDRIHRVEVPRENPAGYKQVLDGYLPEFQLVPALRDVTEETKTAGNSLLSKILSIIISRVANQNPAFKQLQQTISQIGTLIDGTTPEEKLAEIKELENSLKRELEPWNVKLSIGVDPPDTRELLQLGAYIKLDDGIMTGVDEKGHGLQRYLLFALMRVWASEARRAIKENFGESRDRALIFAFEEPELFLHPQMCRATYESLKQISSVNQIMICTHSPHFIDMEDYLSIAMVRKPSLERGTVVQQVQKDFFEDERKKRFNLVRFFNPDRNEVFFARKVGLVEGPTEKAVLPLIARRLGVYDHSVSIINCETKFNITLFMEVLNAFQIPYVVVHDEDPIDPSLAPGDSKYSPEAFQKAKHTFEENDLIKQLCDPQRGKICMVVGKLENLLGVPRSQIDKFGKPLAAVQKYDNDDHEIPNDLDGLVRELYR
jgi:CRISPR-associated exonuclease Cas4